MPSAPPAIWYLKSMRSRFLVPAAMSTWPSTAPPAFIYGIGVSNMKAGDAAYFCALKTLMDQDISLRGDVILTYVVGELQGASKP